MDVNNSQLLFLQDKATAHGQEMTATGPNNTTTVIFQSDGQIIAKTESEDGEVEDMQVLTKVETSGGYFYTSQTPQGTTTASMSLPVFCFKNNEQIPQT